MARNVNNIRKIKKIRTLIKFCFKQRHGSHVVSFDDDDTVRDEFELFFDMDSDEFMAIYRWSDEDNRGFPLMYIYNPIKDEDLETFLYRIFKSMGVEISDAI